MHRCMYRRNNACKIILSCYFVPPELLYHGRRNDFLRQPSEKERNRVDLVARYRERAIIQQQSISGYRSHLLMGRYCSRESKEKCLPTPTGCRQPRGCWNGKLFRYSQATTETTVQFRRRVVASLWTVRQRKDPNPYI